MTITAKTISALLGIFLALLVCAWGILALAVQPGFERLESDLHERDRARVDSNMQAMARDMEARSIDYAQWDDTYAYVSRANPSYIQDNFDDDWFADYDIDVMGIANDAGRVLWAHAVGPEASEAFSQAAVNAALDSARTQSSSNRSSVGVIWVDGHALMLAAARVTSSDGQAAPRGYVVIGRSISAAALSEQVQLRLSLIDPGAPPQELSAHINKFHEKGAHSWANASTLQSLIALRGADGQANGAVLTERTRDVAALGQRSIAAALGLYALASLLAIGALWVVLRRLVIARVLRLDRHLRAQSTSSAELEQLDSDGSNDEIGRLTQSYNDLAIRLGEADAREREAELQREAAATANRMKSDFLANISHELRTPLDSVIGYTELVQEDMADRGLETPREDLQRVLDAARRIADMVGEIHDLSRIEAGRMPISLSSFDIARMLQDVITSAEGMARQNGNGLKVDLAPDLGSAYSDEFRLQQSLVNVLAYCSARTRDGTISLSVRRGLDKGHEALHFNMKDGGEALSDHQLKSLFEPFQALDTTAAFRFGGAGLGLAIAGKVIETIGGRVEARRCDEQGSMIAIVIPVVAPDHALATDKRMRTEADAAA